MGSAARLWKRSRPWATLALSVITLATALWTLGSFGQAGPNPSFAFGSGRNVAPISGRSVEWHVAVDEAGTPLPRLPSLPLRDACNDEVAPLEVREVWSSGPGGLWHIGINYSHGIWMTLAEEHNYRMAGQTELPPLDRMFPSFDYPIGLSDGEVRGHAAWIGEFDPDLRCPRGAGEPSHGWWIYDTSATATLSWKEHDAVIEISGPYPSGVLADLATGIRWLHERRG